MQFSFILPDHLIRNLKPGNLISVEINKENVVCEIKDIDYAKRTVHVQFCEDEDAAAFFTHHLQQQAAALMNTSMSSKLITPSGDEEE